MRFLRSIFIFSFLAIGLTLAFVLIWQEVALAQAKHRLSERFEAYAQAELPSLVLEHCRQLGSQVTTERPLAQLQLRFLDSREFVLEALCDQYEFSPLILEAGALPSSVIKLPGSAGFRYQSGVWRVELQFSPQWLPSELAEWPPLRFLLSRRVNLAVQDGQIAKAEDMEASEPDEPRTSCQGYGFQCCDSLAEQGEGERRNASDCSERCYARCEPLPQVFLVAVEPGFDRQARAATVGRGELVRFTISGEADVPSQTEAHLDFGDGTSWQGAMLTLLGGQALEPSEVDRESGVEHRYSCARAECHYQVEVTLLDAQGRRSVASERSRLSIRVR